MLRSSIVRRLVPPLVVTGLVLTIVVTISGNALMRDTVANRARRRAVSLAAVERDRVLGLMRAGEHQNLQAVLDQLSRHPDVEVVRILHPDGQVHASSRAYEAGRMLPTHVAQTGEHGDVVDDNTGTHHQVVHTAQPFLNSPECRQCHPTQGPVVGWLDLDGEVSDHATGFRALTGINAVLGLGQLLAVLAIVVTTLTVSVRRPLQRITQAMERVQRGDLAVALPSTGTAEIDAGVHGFNQMVGDLKVARQAEEEAARLHLQRVEQLAAVGELAAGLAHEVRNPLSGVKAVIDVLTRECQDEERAHTLRDAGAELVRVDQILKDLLRFARPKPPTLGALDLNALALDTAGLVAPGGETGPRIDCQLQSGLPLALGDAGQIRQVMLNLLLNAQQAATRDGVVTLTTGRGAGHVWCRVRDDGGGVALDRAESIFRPFVTSKSRGTGLGLAISRRIVEIHGGRLTLDNPGLPGASFTFTLPVSPAAES